MEQHEGWRFWFAFTILWIACSLAGIMAVFLTIRPANAQEPCPKYQDLKKGLADAYGEAPAGSGILGEGNAVLMIFASPKGETWTATMLRSDGTACIIAHGGEWLDVIPPEYSMKGRRPA